MAYDYHAAYRAQAQADLYEMAGRMAGDNLARARHKREEAQRKHEARAAIDPVYRQACAEQVRREWKVVLVVLLIGVIGWLGLQIYARYFYQPPAPYVHVRELTRDQLANDWVAKLHARAMADRKAKTERAAAYKQCLASGREGASCAAAFEASFKS